MELVLTMASFADSLNLVLLLQCSALKRSIALGGSSLYFSCF